jgi:hypothetical protein
LNETEALLRKSRRRFVGSKNLQRNYGFSTHRCEDWAEAARPWDAHRLMDSTDRIGYTNGADALREASLAAEAGIAVRLSHPRHLNQVPSWSFDCADGLVAAEPVYTGVKPRR